MFIRILGSFACFIIAFTAFAEEDKLLLICEDFSYGDTEAVKVVENDDGVLEFSEHFAEDEVKSREITRDEFQVGTFEISKLFGYSRTLKRGDPDGWVIEYSCGTTEPIECEEPDED